MLNKSKEIRGLYLIRVCDIMQTMSCLDISDDIIMDFHVNYLDDMILLIINLRPMTIQFKIYSPVAVYVEIYHSGNILYKGNLDDDGIDDYSDIEKTINGYWSES
jgi:hypothetical protein